jgi:hypothetical protein
MSIFGGNGEGFTKNLTPVEIPLLNACAPGDTLIAIRWPGGSDAKFARPRLDRPGLGMATKDQILAYYNEYKTDENGNVDQAAIDADYADYDIDIALPRSYMYDLIELQPQVPNFRLIYNLNIFTSTVEDNLIAIQQLIDNGVQVSGIVAGNECYFVMDFDYQKYLAMVDPIIVACKQAFPTIPIALLACPNGDPDYGVFRRTHSDWNNAMFQYITENPGLVSALDVHLYLSDEIQDATDMHPGPLKFTGSYQASIDAAMKKYVTAYRREQLLYDTFPAYIQRNVPGINLWASEWNSIPAEKWSNTIACGSYIFETFTKHGHNFEYLLVHNLLASWVWGMVSMADKKIDINPSNLRNLPRIGIRALQMAQELQGKNFSWLSDNSNILEVVEGENYMCFSNLDTENALSAERILSMSVSLNSMTKRVKSVTVNNKSVKGTYLYSSAGKTGFMAKGSTASYEVANFTESEDLTLPKNSFGYLKVTVETEPAPVYGCMDPTAKNYNPLATVEDGSCEYWVYGCMSPTASNYNPNATKDDGSCVFPVYGCTDPTAKNYNPNATVNDGSCEYWVYGCMSPTATNYNPNATKDDGSCVFPTPPPPPSTDCDKCKGWWYRLWNSKKCKGCK